MPFLLFQSIKTKREKKNVIKIQHIKEQTMLKKIYIFFFYSMKY